MKPSTFRDTCQDAAQDEGTLNLSRRSSRYPLLLISENKYPFVKDTKETLGRKKTKATYDELRRSFQLVLHFFGKSIKARIFFKSGVEVDECNAFLCFLK